MTRLLGYTPEELASMSPGELTHPDDAERERVLIEELAAGRRTSYGLEKRNRHKDGRWIWVWLTVSLLEGEDPPRSAVAHVLDISERKAAETELERARANLERSNAELDQFAYVASHDLKEPLILLSAYARMLGERHGDALDEEGRTFLGHVRDEAGRMKTMIDDLLDYSRLADEGRGRVARGARETCSIRRCRTLAPRIEEAGAKVDVEGELPAVEGSPAQFERLLPQPDRERAQVPRRRAAGRDRLGRARGRRVGRDACATTGSGSIPAKAAAGSSTSSSGSTARRSTPVPAWDSRSASGSSSGTAGGSGSSPLRAAAARSSSPCRSR